MPAKTTNVRLVAEPKNVGPRIAEILNDLQVVCFPAESDRRQLEDSYWWLATDGKRPVGFAGLKPEGSGFAFLCLAGVVPTARGRRIHDRLIRARVVFARRLGLNRLITYTRTDNPASTNGLIKAGFRSYVPAYSWAGPNVCYWQKEL